MNQLTDILNGAERGEPKVAEAMGRILVESAPRKPRRKRGAGGDRVNDHDSAVLTPAAQKKVLKVHEALEILSVEDPEKAHIVKLWFFVGLPHAEIAALLGVSERTVRRHLEVARARLFKSIKASK